MIREYWKILTLVVFLFCPLSLAPAQAQSIDYDHEINLKNMRFSWKIQQQQLFVRLSARTKGWVGIGFNPTSGMKNANFIIGYVKYGNVKATDQYGIRPEEHIDDIAIDGRNDLTAVSGSEKGGATTIEFAIPMDSKDSADRKINGDGYTTVLLAYGKGQDNFHTRHGFRTSLKVELSTGKYR